jgi:hypothetical protein
MSTMDPAILSPVATLIVGLAIAFFAHQQWSIARHKLRLDLFEKRYNVYEATARFLSLIMSLANFNDDDLRAFNIGTMDAVFLYPKHIKDYLDEIRCRAMDMRTYQREFERLPVGDERNKLVDQNHNEARWLNEQLTRLPTVFAPFLGFASAK